MQAEIKEDQKQLDQLDQDLAIFMREKEKIKNTIGAIGGAKDSKVERLITLIAVILFGLLFIVDLAIHLFGVKIPLPPLSSLIIGVFLVSIKLILLIHQQTRLHHFQFWILNSIEFRLNHISKEIREIKAHIKD